MEYTGTIKRIGKTVIVSDKFKKRELIVTDNASTSYPQTLSFQMNQDRGDVLDSFKEGDEVLIKFNLKGREWTSPQGEKKVFNTLEAWSVVMTGNKSGNKTESATESAQGNLETLVPDGKGDDLPF